MDGYQCIKPACDRLGCVGCNCAIPADVYAAVRASIVEQCAKVCDEQERLAMGSLAGFGLAGMCAAAVRAQVPPQSDTSAV